MDTNSIPTMFGDVAMSPVGPNDRVVYVSPLEYKISYLNNLPMDVVIGYRSGLKFKLPAQRNMFSNLLIIRVEVIIRDRNKTEIQSVLSALDNEITPELKAFRDAYSLQIQHNNAYGTITLIVDYTVDIIKLKRLGGTVYFQELDIVVSINDIMSCQPHPESKEGRDLQLLNAEDVSGDFIYKITLVDNLNKYGPRYISICNKIYRINTCQDSGKRDGIYITTNKAVGVDTIENDDDKAVNYFPIDSEELEIFKSYEEALTLGDSLTNRKQKLVEMELLTLEQKRELQDLKHQNELLLIEKNKEKLILEEERERHKYILEQMQRENEARIESERAKQKDYYENRSYNRKEQSEILKWAPTIIASVAAIIAAVASAYTKK